MALNCSDAAILGAGRGSCTHAHLDSHFSFHGVYNAPMAAQRNATHISPTIVARMAFVVQVHRMPIFNAIILASLIICAAADKPFNGEECYRDVKSLLSNDSLASNDTVFYHDNHGPPMSTLERPVLSLNGCYEMCGTGYRLVHRYWATSEHLADPGFSTPPQRGSLTAGQRTLADDCSW